MLLEYSIENFKMFSEKVSINMVEQGRTSATLKDSSCITYTRHINKRDDSGKRITQKVVEKVNPVGLLYGANGAGKTSLVLSLPEFLSQVGIVPINYEPFFPMLNTIAKQAVDKNKPVICSIRVIHPKTLRIFEYSIEMSIKENQIYYGNEKLVVGQITGESSEPHHLYESQFKEIFNREKTIINTDFKELERYFLDIQIQDTGKENSVIKKIGNLNSELYPEFDGSTVEKTILEFIEACNQISTDRRFEPHNIPYTLYMYNSSNDQTVQNLINQIQNDSQFKENLLRAFENIDVGITNVEITQGENGKELYFVHGDGKRNMIHVPFFEESDGTRKFINQFTYIYKIMNEHGIFILDELENNYHPAIQRYIIDLFISNQAQIITTTHNAELMNYEEIPVESIMFVDKDPMNNKAEVYQLIEFEGILNRSKYNLRKIYEQGRLGAFPRLLEDFS